MSVYIRGMEMPKDCWACPMVSGYEIADEARTMCSTVRCRLTNTKRPVGEAIASDCPLVPAAADAIEELQKRVSKRPHGRLIDADALKVSLAVAEKTAGWAVPALRAALMIIDEMPTIIPAEEGNE